MIRNLEEIAKRIRKGQISKEVFIHFNNALESISNTNDFNLFDIKKLKQNGNRNYFRLRKGKYRAIFYVEDKNIEVVALDRREDVYKKWQ